MQVLGIDLGVASVGWSLLEHNDAVDQGRVAAAGVRVFEAGVEGDIEAGKDQSRAVARRNARLQRRQIWRRARRQARVFQILQSAGLLPDGDPSNMGRGAILGPLDQELRTKFANNGDHLGQQVWLYRIRAEALDRRLDPYELGRAFYHLAQRRGYKSNRLMDADDEDDKELGEVKQGISALDAEMEQSRSRTLGELFAKQFVPYQQGRRIRQRWTARRHYESEFDQIWAAQLKHGFSPEVLTPKLRRRLRRSLFRQRPLKSASHLVARCELEPGARRAALALPIAQRFRLLQKVNDLLVTMPDGEIRRLDAEQRRTLIHDLATDGDRTFAAVRKLLGFKAPKEVREKGDPDRKTRIPGHTFNLERGGEEKLPGDRTGQKLRSLFGRQWDELDEADQRLIVCDFLEYTQPDGLEARLRDHWKLNFDSERLRKTKKLESARAAYSRKALERLVARMEDGTSFATARKEIYPGSFNADTPEIALPPVRQALRDLRNPAVERALTELRKVVNELIRRHGKPDEIHVELARDLKKPRKLRIADSNMMRDRQKDADRIYAEIRQACPWFRKARQDAGPEILRWRLAEECNWECPYTGKAITPGTLLGSEPQFDVEHIIPLSMCLEDNPLNKTLCELHENRHVKRKRSPCEAYAQNPEPWHAILGRVSRFRGKDREAKMRRFQMSSEQIREFYGGTFPIRSLNDTKYAAKLAKQYLGRLYGGECDRDGRRRVFAVTGGSTWFLRQEWGVEAIIPQLAETGRAIVLPPELRDGGKDRADHRHHAIDAAVIALTSQSTIKRLADAAERLERQPQKGRRRFVQVPLPWPGFYDELKEAVDRIVVSHRPDRRVAGKLHADTLYSKPFPTVDPRTGKPSTEHHVRKLLSKLSRSELEGDKIVDPIVRAVVRAAWEKRGKGEPFKVFADAAQDPCMRCRQDGPDCACTPQPGKVPIHKVRVVVGGQMQAVGTGPRLRYTDSGKDTLHHTVIVARKNKKGVEKWEDHPVDRLEVHRRKAAGEPIIRTDYGEDARVVMWFCKGDVIEMDDPVRGGISACMMKSISQANIVFGLHCDARTRDEIRSAGQRSEFEIRTAEQFKKRNATKMSISPTGILTPIPDGGPWPDASSTSPTAPPG